MRGAAPAIQLALMTTALVIGALLACYRDDYLLGALCYRDADCGDDQCCAGVRCRPQPDDCLRTAGVDEPTPFLPAYQPCDRDEQCLVHGQPVCAHWAGASVGFCTDFCVGDPTRNCELHSDGFPVDYTPRTCATVDGQSVCAIDCSADPACPPEMQCHQGVCVPSAAP